MTTTPGTPVTPGTDAGPVRSRWDWRDATLPLALALLAIAGLVLWSLSDALSPYMHLTPPGGHAHHHGAARHLGPIAVIVLFSVAWLAMTVAHMLPTAIPMLGAFRRTIADRPHRSGLVPALVGGFLLVWAAAGVVVAVVHAQILALVEANALQELTPLLLALVLAAAGAYQFTRYVNACLTACRTPTSFLARHWQGGPHPGRQALTIGLDYGRSCLGCCAALMIVMFVLGAASHLWMLLFALLGVIQKSTRWGQALTKPIGIAFLLTAATITLTNLNTIQAL